MVTGTRRVPSLAENLHRMLDKAHAEGVRILDVTHCPDWPGLEGARVSSSRIGLPPYFVILKGSEAGCDCPGYEKHGYCKHWALVLDRAGLLPDLEEEPGETPAAAACINCGLPFTVGSVGVPVPGGVQCPPCARLANPRPGVVRAAAEPYPPASTDLEGPMPWELPNVAVITAMQHPDRKAAAYADLTRRQSLHPARPVDLEVA